MISIVINVFTCIWCWLISLFRLNKKIKLAISKVARDEDIVLKVLQIVKDRPTIRNLHTAYVYPDWVVELRLYPAYGWFVEYILRHRIESIQGAIIEDRKSALTKNTAIWNSYVKYCSNNDTRSIIPDIWNVAMSADKQYQQYVDLQVEHLPIGMIDSLYKWVEELVSFHFDIQTDVYVSSEKLGLHGYIDCICGDNIIDFKVSKGATGYNTSDFVLLILYAAICGRSIDKLIIYNPLRGLEYHLPITSELLQQIRKLFTY